MLAGVEQLSAHLPSSIPSPESGKRGQNEGIGDQTESVESSDLTSLSDDFRATLASVGQAWQKIEMASPRGFEPLGDWT